MTSFPYLPVEPRFPEKEEHEHIRQIPDDAVFVCAYLTFLNPADFGNSAFFRRVAGEDQLWHGFWDYELDPRWNELQLWRQGIYEEFGLSIAAPAKGDVKKSAMNLIGHLFRSSFGYRNPSKYIMAGLLVKDDYSHVVEDYKNERKEYEKAALKQESSVVRAVKALGLRPRPSGEGPHSWSANCPGTSHPIWIDTKTDKFGCPWCRKKGGPEELEAFVKERLAKGYQL